MFTELNHVGIVVRDLDRSLDFYLGTLGGHVVFEGFIAPTQTTIRYVQISGGMIELLHRGKPDQDEIFGIQHIAFISDDLDDDFRRLVNAGHPALSAPKAAGSGVGRLAFVEDPSGARVELIQRDVDFRRPVDGAGIIRSFDHYGINARDLHTVEQFYGRDLGMSPIRRLPVGNAGMVVSFFEFGYDVVSLISRPTPVPGNPLAHIGLRVDDLEAAAAEFERRGVRAEPGTPKPAGTGYGSILVIRDPDDVKLEIIDRADLREL